MAHMGTLSLFVDKTNEKKGELQVHAANGLL